METTETKPVETTEQKPVETKQETVNTQSPVADTNDDYFNLPVLGYGNQITIPPKTGEEKKEEATTTEKAKENTAAAPPSTQETSSLKTESDKLNEGSEQKVTEEFDELNPEALIKELDKIAQEQFKFKSYEDLKAYKSIDYFDNSENGIGEAETIEDWMRMKDPGTTQAEVDAFFLKYEPLWMEKEAQDKAVEEGKLTRAQLIQLEAEFNKTLRTAQNELTEDQNKIDLSKVTIKQKKSAEPNQNKAEPSAEILEHFKKTVGDFAKTFNEDVFQVKDKDGKVIDEVKFTLTPEQHQANLEAAQNAYKRWVNADGSLNVQKFYSELHYLNNREKMYSDVYKRGMDKGAETQVKDINNIKFEQPQTPNTEVKPKTMSDLIFGS